MNNSVLSLLQLTGIAPQLFRVAEKVLSNDRISVNEGILLYTEGTLPFLSLLAESASQRVSDNHVFFNRNFHIEPTNICVNHCAFCSYRRRKGEEGCWEFSIEDIKGKVDSYKNSGATEVHIVGGVHPDRDVHFYADMIRAVKECMPAIHIKAFTAVEIDSMCRQAGLTIESGLQILKEAGLDSMPGGGAEIFDVQMRQKICPDKTGPDEWLRIHKTAHELSIPTNATMLYGLLETYEHRIDHMERLRTLQDETKGFNAFIPLKFKHYNNSFSHIKEATTVEDLKNYAMSRIFLDNIPHLKAYWPMIGKQVAQLSLAFGVDDLDGTIDDSTKIYSMAGSDEQNPSASTDELIAMIKGAGKIPAERDTVYNIIKIF
ncbi:MAG: aminofutalosine synthase MqnE [Bacteroidia bacterium]|nr:aminofutalosine synthase MqnE [Bacteroidia bacterium]